MKSFCADENDKYAYTTKHGRHTKTIKPEKSSAASNRKIKKKYYEIKSFEPRSPNDCPSSSMIEREIEVAENAVKDVISESKVLIESHSKSFKLNNAFRNEDSATNKSKLDWGDSFGIRLSKPSAPLNLDSPDDFELEDSETVVEFIKTLFFEPIDTNVVAEDAFQFTNLPLVSEDMDENAVAEEIYKHYSNGIHGYLKNKYEISYEMLFKTMKKLLSGTSRPDLLYYALYYLFPNYGSQDEFSKIYPKLVKRFSSDHSNESLLAMESWKVGNDETRMELILMDVTDPYNNRNHVIKIIDIFSESNQPCSQNCFKSLMSEDFTGSILKILDNIVEGKIVVHVKKSIPKTHSPFLNALLNNEEQRITKFCETAKKFEQRDCAGWFRILLACCTPENQLKTFKSYSYKEREKRFRGAMKVTNAKLVRDNNLEELSSTVHPCSHLGPCGPNSVECVCKLMCTVYCACDANCSRKFMGCDCQKGQCKTKSCPCFNMGFECNELTCAPCVKDDIKCKNRVMKIGLSKKVHVGRSNIAAAGNGLFIDEAADKYEYIGEYTGEVVSEGELERRGAVDKYSISYMFSLGKKGGVDSRRAGNLFRYINHSNTNINCYCQFKNVDGNTRIGFYAARRLIAGEELFFDYNYDEENIETFFNLRPEDRAPKMKNYHAQIIKTELEYDDNDCTDVATSSQTRPGRKRQTKRDSAYELSAKSSY